MSHKLAIITVIYENYTVLNDFLQSLSKQKNNNFRLFIVDNSTRPQSIELRHLSSTVIISPNNGYSAAVNLGLKKAKEAGFMNFVVINDDTYFKADFVDNILNRFSESPGSLIGGKIYYAPGYEYHKDRYKTDKIGKVLWYAGGQVDLKNALIAHRGVDEVDNGQYDQPEKTDFISGCFIAFDQTVINKIGYWDEKYFLYYEDADFCERARRQQIPLIYDPRIQLWHKNAQSTDGAGSMTHRKYQRKNRLRWGLKYSPIRTKAHLLLNFFFEKR